MGIELKVQNPGSRKLWIRIRLETEKRHLFCNAGLYTELYF